MTSRSRRSPRSIALACAALTLVGSARLARAQAVGSDSGRTAAPPAPASTPAATRDSGDARASAALPASAQLYRVGDSTLVYLPAGRAEFLRRVPGTLVTAGRQTFRWRNAGKAAALAALTLGLVASDQQIFDETRRFSDRAGISAEHPSIDFKVSGAKLFYVPTSISSAMYYLGDGWTTMTVAGSFLTVGMLRDDHRAVRTASEITQSLLALGVVTQTLKHVSGRQTPSEATAPGGRWRPMPSLGDYSKNVPAYDAFPSGHLATAMATVTVVALNYPEKRWIKPVGYGLMSVLAFQMVNNGVHWASDYPLALAIGGTVGRIAVESGRTVLTGASNANSRRVEPVLAPGRVGAQLRF